jgi:putative glutathione S-transferase
VLIVRVLKGLEDAIDVVELDTADDIGWAFGGKSGPSKDPRYGFTHLRDLYLKAFPKWDGRSSVPALWDTKKGFFFALTAAMWERHKRC